MTALDQQLAKLSFLAPDIISAIVDGSQPENLKGRRILRMGNVPLCSTAQRAMLEFSQALTVNLLIF